MLLQQSQLQSQALLNQARQSQQHLSLQLLSQRQQSQPRLSQQLQSQPRLSQRQQSLQLQSLQLRNRLHLSRRRRSQRQQSQQLLSRQHQSLVLRSQVLRAAQLHALCQSLAVHAAWLITHFLPVAVQAIVLHLAQVEQRVHAKSHRVASVMDSVQTTVKTSHSLVASQVVAVHRQR